MYCPVYRGYGHHGKGQECKHCNYQDSEMYVKLSKEDLEDEERSRDCEEGNRS